MMFARILMTSLLALLALSAQAAPKADLWERWATHDADSVASIDHGSWDSFLKEYVVEDGSLNRLRYSHVSTTDRKALEDYIQRLAATPVSRYNRNQQLAYWINLYNATTVKLILDNYPVQSIRDIKSGLFSFGPWDIKLLDIEGQKVSLNDIEHRILRPIWQTPLIHYAVNCASVGCPNLPRDAYTAANTLELAARNARAYVNSPRGVRIQDGQLVVSSIYSWFESDFGGSEEAVIEHLLNHANLELRDQLAAFSTIDKDSYDWSLNEAE